MGFRPAAPDIDVIGSAFGFPPTGMQAGKSYGSPFAEQGAGAHNPTGGLLCADAIFIPRDLAITSLECEVIAGAAASNLRMGIYEDNGLGFPGDLVAGSDVSVSSVAAGIKTGVINLTLVSGLYWLAHVRQDVGNPSFVGVKTYIGIVGNTGVNRVGGGVAGGYRDGIGNHQGALPAAFPGFPNTIQNNASLQVRVMIVVT